MQRAWFALSLPLVVALFGGCPSAGECATDGDCPTGEECRSLQESDENVCVRPSPSTDGGPIEEGDPVAVTSFTATPNPVASGGDVTLTWETVNATSCALSGVGGVDDSGTTTVTPADNTRYTLSCQGTDGPATESIDLAVEVEVTALSLAPDEVNVARDVTASWTTVGASGCTFTAGSLTQAVTAADVGEGSLTFAAEESGDVSLSCEGAAGPAVETAALAVARVATFTATPASVPAGGQTTLAWTTENVSDCAVDDVTDANAGDDQVVVTVNETTSYTLRCTGFTEVDAGPVDILATVEVATSGGGGVDAGPDDAGTSDAGDAG